MKHLHGYNLFGITNADWNILHSILKNAYKLKHIVVFKYKKLLNFNVKTKLFVLNCLVNIALNWDTILPIELEKTDSCITKCKQ